MEKLELNGVEYLARTIPTPHGRILIIRAQHGLLCCSYISVETADAIGDAVAIVTGVGGYHEMMNAEIVRVSKAAAELGITPGMRGLEALERMK